MAHPIKNVVMELSAWERGVLCECMDDAVKSEGWSDEWKKRVQVVLERFQAVQTLIGDVELAESKLECEGVELRYL